jgi:hypothetical protein
MKNLIILSAAIFIITASANAQTSEAIAKHDIKLTKKQEHEIKKEKKEERKELRKLEGNEVNNQAKLSFNNDFGNIFVTKWKRSKNFDEATFNNKGEIMTAFYDFDAKLVGTITKKTFADLPANAQTLIDKKYNGYSKESVLFFDDNELNETDMVLFGSQFKDADNYFVELKKGNDKIILKVNMNGEVSFFKQLK